MKTINVVNGPHSVPAIIQGCMRMPALDTKAAADLIRCAYELGINFFDHAKIYGAGEAERRFGDAFPMTGLRREDVIIQSKCGICPDRKVFDWSYEEIVTSVDESLERLKTDYLDVLLLHRPDLLYDPEEVAEAFDALESAGKVRHFGMSNVPPMMFEVLKKYVKQPLVFDQVQFSMEQSQLLDQTLFMNNKTTDMSLMRDGGLLDYCRLHDITIQCWSPLQLGMFGGNFVDNPAYPELNKAIAEVGEKYGLSRSAAAIAFILRHPADMQVIAGTMNKDHLADLAAAADVELSRDDWYKLYLASGKFLP